MSLFITFDGNEGSGKSTQIQLLSAYLQAQNIPHYCTREIGGCSLGEEIRQQILHRQININPISELLLILAARKQHWHEVIKSKLDSGLIVICDRFNDSTYAYQGSGRDLGWQIIKQLEALVMPEIKVDLRFIFDINLVTQQKRLQARGKNLDKIEKENSEFFQRVRAGYLQRAQEEKAILIDGSASIAEISNIIQTKIRECLAG